MRLLKGEVLPLGVRCQGVDCVNFAIPVAPHTACTLQLFKTGEENPVYEYAMDPDPNIQGVRYLALAEWDQEVKEYCFCIGGESQVDPYATGIRGREVWGEKIRPHVRGVIPEVPSAENKSMQEQMGAVQIPEEAVIGYRLHVRGFTMHPSSKVREKGCFAGILEKIPYLQSLGVNQVQLMPCYEFMEEGTPLNYWGYAPGFVYAPKQVYGGKKTGEQGFQELVNGLHQAGMEVILDMPFVERETSHFQLECLRYWVLQYQVDGFLLNPCVTNVEEMKQDCILQNRKILVADEGFQTTMRRFLKGDEDMVQDVMWKLRQHSGAEAVKRYNTMATHNGFTLQDVVSYDGKHNEANGERNQDGTNYNYCWNCGAEGPTRKKPVLELREKQLRNAWALLLLAQGTPCILAGDEFGNTQKGNNNAYCQDNAIAWLDWKLLKKQGKLFAYVQQLIALRKNHPVLHQTRPLQGMDQMQCGMPDISYHGEEAWRTPSEVASRQLGVLYCGKYAQDQDCFVAYNMHWMEHDFALPSLPKSKAWYQILDTATGSFAKVAVEKTQRKVEVAERSIAVFVSE